MRENEIREVTALGGKFARGLSPVCDAEAAALHGFKEKVLALVPINTNEKAAEYRKLIREFMPSTVKKMAELSLT
jgi:hypothetical protein